MSFRAESGVNFKVVRTIELTREIYEQLLVKFSGKQLLTQLIFNLK